MDTIIHFGPHKDKKISEAPYGYVVWLAGYHAATEGAGDTVLSRYSDCLYQIIADPSAWTKEEKGTAFVSELNAIAARGMRSADVAAVIVRWQELIGKMSTETARQSYLPWIEAFLTNRDAVDAARQYIMTSKRCIACEMPVSNLYSQDKILHLSCMLRQKCQQWSAFPAKKSSWWFGS